ncbi:tetratricopeptide repeat protein, partial [Acinetobacter baumannii]
KDAELLAERSSAYGKLRQYQKAVDDANAALAINPNLIFAYYCRGAGYARLHQIDKTVADCKKITELTPTDERGHRLRGDSFALLNLYPQAFEE